MDQIFRIEFYYIHNKSPIEGVRFLKAWPFTMKNVDFSNMHVSFST